MGAGNSMPLTQRIENPKRVVPIEITPSVVTRLETEQKLQQKSEGQQTESKPNGQEEPKNRNQFVDPGKIQPSPRDWSQAPGNVFEEKFNESQENQFNRTVEMLEGIIGKPVVWMDNVEREINELRKNLIKCYRDNPGETLCCADVAKKYQEFIFREQYRSILKFNDYCEKPIPAPPPPPYQHSPPYV